MRYIRLIAILTLLSSLGYTLLRWRAHVNWRPTQVVLVSVESLPVSRLGCYGATSSSAPNIDALARQSVVFERASGAARRTLRTDATTLAELFQRRGTATVAVNPGDEVQHGFQVVLTQPFAPPPHGDTAALLTWLAEHARQPFFLWIHDRGPPSPAGDDAAMAWSDALVGRLLRQLATLGIGDGQLIVFTASRTADDPRVPLLIAAPRFDARRVDTPVELVDVFSTIAALADLPRPSDMQGTSLVALLDGQK